jgi:tetratricopeptide (TPR) repeat protein
MKPAEPTPVSGIRYCVLPAGSVVTGLDQRVRISCDDLPLPLLEDDYDATEGFHPSYDAVGRGIYHVLRANPDCAFGARYARILQEGYPHFIAEMASHILMLDKKDVDVAYLDRKINYLKVFALIEPGNARFLLEIGLTFMDKGLRLPALHLATASLYRAEEFLRKALLLTPGDATIRYQLGEVSYILGKYDDVLSFWNGIICQLEEDEVRKIEQRLRRIEAGTVPKVPAVDYLEAIGAALSFHNQGEFAEAAGILLDVLDDDVFCEEFPLPEISYVLGLCCSGMGMPRYAEDYFRGALQLNPDYDEARNALANLGR